MAVDRGKHTEQHTTDPSRTGKLRLRGLFFFFHLLIATNLRRARTRGSPRGLDLRFYVNAVPIVANLVIVAPAPSTNGSELG